MVTASLTDTLSRIGAIGGIIAAVGTGLLILLVASQARQLRSMREWIDEEPQRQAETAARVIAEVQRRIAAARERRHAPAAPPVPAPPKGDAIVPAPGTLGAAAIAAGTAPAQAGSGSVAPPTPGAPSFGAATAAGAAAGAAGETPRFAPLTPAAGDTSVDTVDTALDTPIDDDEPAVVSSFSSQDTQLSEPLPDESFAPPPGRATAAGRSRDVRFGEDEFEDEEDHEATHPTRSKVLFGIGALALIAGIVLLATQLFGGGESPTPNASNTQTPAATTPTSGAAATTVVDPATVALRVLNGTQISGLALRVNVAMRDKGYSVGEPATASNENSLTSSVVYYREGFKSAAQQVAKDLSLSSSAVRPIDSDTSVTVGESAEVVVLAGSDLDSGDSASSTG